MISLSASVLTDMNSSSLPSIDDLLDLNIKMIRVHVPNKRFRFHRGDKDELVISFDSLFTAPFLSFFFPSHLLHTISFDYLLCYRDFP